MKQDALCNENVDELKKKVLELKYAARYKAALHIVCEQYATAVDCDDCKYKDSCRLFPKDGENDKSLCGETVKRVIEDRVKKAGIE